MTLEPGKRYLLDSGEILEFSGMGQTGLAIFHPPGEPDMQSSVAVELDDIVAEIEDR